MATFVGAEERAVAAAGPLADTIPSGLTIVPVMFSWVMSVLFEINRDFPFQVASSFDEAAMEVLEWLDDAPFEWDM